MTYIEKLCFVEKLDNNTIVEEIGLSWYKVENENSREIIKFLESKSNSFIFTIKKDGTERNEKLYSKIVDFNKLKCSIYLACEFDDRFDLLQITNLDKLKDSKKNNKEYNIVINYNNGEYIKSGDNNHIDIEIEFKGTYNKTKNCSEYAKDKFRIYNLATKERIDGFGGRENFLEWYEKKEKICCYCGVEENDLTKYFKETNEQYKNARQRGQFLEIERIQTNSKEMNTYNSNNVELACYICNNAKSDFLSAKSFKPIARGINQFWSEYLKKYIEFNECDKIWENEPSQTSN